MSENSLKTILFLAANPDSTGKLRLDQEVRDIEECLSRSQHRDKFELKSQWAVRPRDIQKLMLDYRPQIVHFSGHGVVYSSVKSSGRDVASESDETGSTPEGLVFEDESGQIALVGTQAIAQTFELFADQLDCVFLNACYSEKQAFEIAEYIPYVIGMNRAIGDQAAQEFAVGFYEALGAGREFEFAFKLACNRIALAGIPEDRTPVLIRQASQSSTHIDVEGELINVLELESPRGLVGEDAVFYVASPYEDRCFEEIKKPGSLIRIKSPHNMGKSSLMVRVLSQAERLGYRTVSLDLDQTNQKFFFDADRFMQWFCASVGKQLGLRVKVDEYWDDIFGANDNSTDYFENYLLNDKEPPLALAIDNFDRIFNYPEVEIDFCGLLRGWFERSNIKSQWQKLRLIVVHSQESYGHRDLNQSPFNVGLPIELGEFTEAQVRDLVMRHGLTWSDAELAKFLELIGGHPSMVRLGLYSIAIGDLSLPEFLRTAPTEAGIYSDRLLSHLKLLEEYLELGAAMKAVVEAVGLVNVKAAEAFKLDSMGLVVRVGNEVKPRCLLYRLYF